MKGECVWITYQLNTFQTLSDQFPSKLGDYFKNEQEYEDYTKKSIDEFILRDSRCKQIVKAIFSITKNDEKNEINGQRRHA